MQNQGKYDKKQQDLKKKAHTFDYDGEPIFISHAKTEKFPPSAFHINYNVHHAFPEDAKDKRPRRTLKDVKHKNKKVPEKEQEFISKI
mmetsp:Transcript_6915/g.6188  ORF Transcript_6915/g.6188 Transcript_6915/m.6188 type:complete len:88 (+) Transcript_6915:409-672(+)